MYVNVDMRLISNVKKPAKSEILQRTCVREVSLSDTVGLISLECETCVLKENQRKE